MKKIVLFLVLVSVMCVMPGYQASAKASDMALEKLVNRTWRHPFQMGPHTIQYLMVYKSDFTYNLTDEGNNFSMEGKYAIKDGKLVFLKDEKNKAEGIYDIIIQGNTLTTKVVNDPSRERAEAFNGKWKTLDAYTPKNNPPYLMYVLIGSVALLVLGLWVRKRRTR